MAVKKTYSDLDLLLLSNKTLRLLERDAENGNSYAIAILKEVFDNRKGTGPSNETQSTRFLPENQPHQHSKQVLKIGKVKSTSAASY